MGAGGPTMTDCDDEFARRVARDLGVLPFAPTAIPIAVACNPHRTP